MNPSSRIVYAFKALAGLAICLSLFWLWQVVVVPWLKFLDAFQPDAMSIAFIVFMPILMGLPALFGMCFGWRSLRKTDAATVKGLVASYCFGLACFLAVSLGARALPGLNEDVVRDLVILLSAVVSVGIYLFVSRWLLRSLGLDCPSIRQSLPKWAITFVALLLWQALIGWVLADFPLHSKRSDSASRDLTLFIGATLLAVLVNKLGVWLFVKQRTVFEAGVSAK